MLGEVYVSRRADDYLFYRKFVFGSARFGRIQVVAYRTFVVCLCAVFKALRSHRRMIGHLVSGRIDEYFIAHDFGFALGVCKQRSAIGAGIVCLVAVFYTAGLRFGIVHKRAVSGGANYDVFKREFLFGSACFVGIQQFAVFAFVVFLCAVCKALGGYFFVMYHLVSGCGDKYLGVGKFVIHRLVVEQRSAFGAFVVSYGAVFKAACRHCAMIFELKMSRGVDYYFVADDFLFTLGISKHLTAAPALIVCLAAVGIAAGLNGGMICKFNMSRCLNCKFGVGEFGFAVLIGKDESASRAFVVFLSAVFKTLGRYCLVISEVVTSFNDDVVFIHLILAGGIGEVSAASRTGIVCYITVFGAGGFYCRMGGEFVGKGRYLHARYLISAGFVGIILAAVIASVVRNIARMLTCGGDCRYVFHIVPRGGYGEFGIRKFGVALGVREYQTAA